MPKAEPMSAKALSQRLKWRGLQKLKFYCQLCEKQMRDDNGFKCHMMSEGHQRNLLIASESPEKYIKEYSSLFHRDYMALLKRRWGTTRVHCNVVYCEYVAHKTHYHMNATQWTTLTQYVQWLGEQGYCKVDYQDDGPNRGGWYVQYIDKDPEVERRKRELERLARKQQDMDERHNDLIAQMVERDAEKKDSLDILNEQKVEKSVNLDEDREKLNITLPKGSAKIAEKYTDKTITDGALGFKGMVAQMAFKAGDSNKNNWSKTNSNIEKPKPMSNLELIRLENEAAKKIKQEAKEEIEAKEEYDSSKKRKMSDSNETDNKRRRSGGAVGPSLHTVRGEGLEIKKKDQVNEIFDNPEPIDVDNISIKSSEPEDKPWILPNISVKIITKDLSDNFYKKKGKILSVENEFEAIVQMFKTNTKIKIDQSLIETIIPAVGRKIVVLTGKYRGRFGKLKAIQAELGTLSVDLDATFDKSAKFLTGLKYDQISKVIT